MGTSKDVINSTKKMLNSSFDMKDLGQVDVILGIQIKRNNDGYILRQSHYVKEVLRKFGHFDCKLVAPPFGPSSKLRKHVGELRSRLEYS